MWLSILKELNLHYADIGELPKFGTLRQTVQNANNENATHIKDARIVSRNEEIADDVARVRTSISIDKSSREAMPLNEFGENDHSGITASFPDLSRLGNFCGENKKKSMWSKERHHSLQQFNGGAQNNSELIFFLVNQLTRHTNCREVANR